MKKIILLIGIMSLMLLAQSNKEKSKYLKYTNQIINYEFFINNINKINSPFYKHLYFNENNGINKNSRLQKRAEIILLSIFGNKAYIKINKYIGEQLISTKKLWVNKDEKIMGCKLVKLTDTDAYFKCRKKTLYKTLNTKILNIKE